MGDYPYTTVPRRIPKLFQKIKEIGIPPEVNSKWLKSIGFTAVNDRTLLRILPCIGFVDESNIPTQRWQEYRGTNGKQVLAEGIYQGYKDLFLTYPDACKRSREELESFFSTRSAAGKTVIEKTVSTFLELCKLADFDSLEPQSNLEHPEKEDVSGNAQLTHTVTSPRKGFVININIQLTLPETTDQKVYEALFLAMKKHLLQECD